MFKVKIYGAGSIGNHLAYAARSIGCDILMCDVDKQAIERTKNHIYPSRYGKWDSAIRLCTVEELPKEKFDVVIIGTPPDSHIEIALEVLRNDPPKVLTIEKPLCPPSLEGCQELLKLSESTGTFVTVAYNHTLTENTLKATEIVKSGSLGMPLTMTALFREHWGGIFSAHPWLDGPADSYLGFSRRGGGASGEHSHAINIWQHFAHLFDVGRIVQVSAMLDVINDGEAQYDRICQLSVKTENGLVGNIVQDVITEPTEKYLRVQCSEGALEWHVNWEEDCDAVLYRNSDGTTTTLRIDKTRPDDFKGEIEHIRDLLNGEVRESPVSLQRGLETMLVIAAAHFSNKTKQSVFIDYERGFTLDALVEGDLLEISDGSLVDGE